MIRHTFKAARGRVTLTRERDGVGDAGSMLLAVHPDEPVTETLLHVVAVGYSCRVGALGTRTFGGQDYWQTTPVARILGAAADGTYCRFERASGQRYRLTVDVL